MTHQSNAAPRDGVDGNVVPQNASATGAVAAPPAWEVKRVIEVWTSGLYPKEDILANPKEILGAHNAIVDENLLSALAATLDKSKASAQSAPPPVMADFNAHLDVKLQWRELIRTESAPSNPRLRAWRERQIRRCQAEIGQEQNRQIVHAPLAFELTQGCTVGCWFCALDAGPLTEVFRYTPENAALWRGVLETVRDVIGPAARWGSSYWATEPLDNGDYEHLCRDFHEVLGMFPQTTTAVPWKSPDRVRALLRESLAKGCQVNRFSVHTGGQLKEIHQTYTAEELAWTELILQNKESESIKAHSGKLLHFRERFPKRAEAEERKLVAMIREREAELAAKANNIIVNAPNTEGMVTSCCAPAEGQGGNLIINIPGTTSCISGFIINMPERRVDLISPCTASDRWPKGYILYDQGHFETAEDLRDLMNAMIERNMAETISPDSPVAFAPQMTYVEEPNGFRLSTAYGSMSCLNDENGDYLRFLGGMINEGKSRAGEIAIQGFYRFGKHEALTLGTINNFFVNGMLDETRLNA